jgi:hypothetical protein
MRYLVVALMIVLLPLRGWAADTMATKMASSVVAIESESAGANIAKVAAESDHKNQASETPHAAPDCHEQMAGHPDAENAANSDHCGTCQACQACHSVALSASLSDVTTAFTSHHLSVTRAFAFTSAAPALGQKPPIS